MATIVKKGDKSIVYPIDQHCKHAGEIVIDGDDVYSCTLNQTDLKTNANKFYIMQLIHINGSQYCLYTRWGRIGEMGRPTYNNHSSLDSGISAFEKQFKAKTGNLWNNRLTNFVRKNGKYYMTEVTYETNNGNDNDNEKNSDNKDNAEVANNNDNSSTSKTIQQPKAVINERVQYLLSLISDVETMNRSLVELKVDPKKMPLGKISNEQLDKARGFLQEIRQLISTPQGKSDTNKIMELSSAFYTYVPYSCGRKKPPVIDNPEILSDYDNMIDELKNLAVAIKLIENVQTQNERHPMDVLYDGLKTNIVPVEKDSITWNRISDYITNTHGTTHRYKTQLLDIYAVQRNGETDKYDELVRERGIKNKMLLWHGSRMTNFCSILQNGLILNPETLGAYITGKMFSQGIYTANSFSKSFNYCGIESSNNIACLLLCEVAVGNQCKKYQSDYRITEKSLLADGYNSTWGAGKSTPSGGVYDESGVYIPNGKLGKTKDPKVNSLLYDEFVVYNQHQLTIKYMVIVKKT